MKLFFSGVRPWAYLFFIYLFIYYFFTYMYFLYCTTWWPSYTYMYTFFFLTLSISNFSFHASWAKLFFRELSTNSGQFLELSQVVSRRKAAESLVALLFFIFYNNFYLFHYSWLTVFCQFSTVQQGDPVIHTCIHSFFSQYHAPS